MKHAGTSNNQTGVIEEDGGLLPAADATCKPMLKDGNAAATAIIH